MFPTVVFWQNELSIHQEALLKEFARLSPSPVWVVTNKGLPEKRISQGWENVDYGSVEIRITRSLEVRRKIIAELGPEAIHIISGLGREKTLAQTQRLLISAKARLGFYLEPWNETTFFRRLGLPVYYRWKLRRSARIKPFFLTTAESCFAQLALLGIQRDQVFPFGYFLKSAEYQNDDENAAKLEARKRVKLIYVGALSSRKQALLLAHSVVDMHTDPPKLTVIGGGEDDVEISNLAKNYPDRIEYLGAISNREARLHMRASDFLILPSIFDGWGAVLTEALAEGTPILASKACGAAQVITTPQQGYVFEPGEKGIRLALEFALENGPTDSARRMALSTWATKALTGGAGANYLHDILNYRFGLETVRPEAPWETNLATHGKH